MAAWGQKRHLCNISFGPDLIDEFRRSASYIDRILRGASPAELPVQAMEKYEMVINLKTARALGLEVPLHLQQLADEVDAFSLRRRSPEVAHRRSAGTPH